MANMNSSVIFLLINSSVFAQTDYYVRVSAVPKRKWECEMFFSLSSSSSLAKNTSKAKWRCQYENYSNYLSLRFITYFIHGLNAIDGSDFTFKRCMTLGQTFPTVFAIIAIVILFDCILIRMAATDMSEP